LQAVLDGAARRDERQAWLAAQYAAFAYHDPKKMPPDPTEDRRGQRVDPDVAEEMRAIQTRVKLANDAAKARRQHGS